VGTTAAGEQPQASLPIAARSAFASAILSVVSIVTLALMLGVDRRYRLLDDIVVFLFTLTRFPLLPALHRVATSGLTSGFAFMVLGTLGLGLMGLLQALILAGVLTFERVSNVLDTAAAGFGVAIAAVSILAWRRRSLPGGLSLLGVVLGVTLIIPTLSIWLGPDSPAGLGKLGTFLLYPIWAVRVGRLLSRSDAVAAPS